MTAQVHSLYPDKLDEGAPEMQPLIRLAKNLAWELKPDTPLFVNYTLDSYWTALSMKEKKTFVAAVEVIVKGLQLEIQREQALNNGVNLWLEKFLN